MGPGYSGGAEGEMAFANLGAALGRGGGTAALWFEIGYG